MSTKNISTLEARLTVAEATIRLMKEEINELMEKMAGSTSVSNKEEAKKTKKEKKEKKERDPDAPKRPLSEWNQMTIKIASMLSKEVKEQLKEIGFNHMKVAGYLKNKVSGEVQQSEVDAAVEYLVAHPEYKSKTDEIRSEKSSVSGGEEKKVRGRPKKEKAEKTEKTIEVVASSEDDNNEKAEEWEFAGEQFYKLSKSNAIIDAEFEYVGVYDGKKIDRKAEMPASVKKYLVQFM